MKDTNNNNIKGKKPGKALVRLPSKEFNESESLADFVVLRNVKSVHAVGIIV